MPIAVGIVIGVLLHIGGMSDVVCACAGATIAVPGAITTFILLTRYTRRQDDERNGRA